MLGIELSPHILWGIIPRLIGFLYVLAFGSLIPQLPALVGSKGIVPIAPRLRAIRRDFPGLRRFAEYPTLFWLSSSDLAVKLLAWVGVLCGITMMFGGPAAHWALGLAWLLWLSLEPAAVIFPWDTMLQEAGFLALFLPVLPALPQLTASELPSPSLVFMLQWLVIRLMWGFGRVKFVGATKQDRLYMRGFFVWTPVPTPLGWLAHHAPRCVLRAMLWFMFVAEVVAPLLGLLPATRAISFVLLVSLMLGIHATGSWGFFNIGYVLLCLSLLDTRASIFDWWREPWVGVAWQWPHVAVNALLLVMFITSLLYLVAVDSWIGRTFVNLDLDRWVWNRTWARVLLRYLRVLAPFRVVNGYGVFAPHSDAPMRLVPVFEGSNDGGETWRTYRYKYLSTRPGDRPRFVAPHQPRFDMFAYYSALCCFDASFFGAYIGDGSPYSSWTRSSGLDRVAQRLLENEPCILRQFGENPFPEAAPDLVRVSVLALTPTTLGTLRATGDWWHVKRLGVFAPARGRELWPERYTYPMPELFHPDWVYFKRRAPALQAIVRAYRLGMEPDAAIIQGSDLTADDVREFWQQFVPALNVARGDFSRHIERAAALEARFGIDGIVRFERILERFAWLLRVHTERYQYADSKPSIAIESTFRFHLFLHDVVSDGSAAYRSILAHPETAAARAERSSDETQLWTLTLLRHDLVMTHASAFRWAKMMADAYEYKLPGIFEYIPLLVSLKPPGEVYRPHTQLLADGEHIIEGFYPPPNVTTSSSYES